MSPPPRLAHEALLLAFAQIAGLAAGFMAAVIQARTLGPEDRGVYAWVLTLAGFAVQVANLAPYGAVRALAVRQPDRSRFAATLVLLCCLGWGLSLPILAYAWFDPALGRAHRDLLLAAWLGVPFTAATLPLAGLVHLRAEAWRTLTIHLAPRLAALALTLALWSAGGLTLASAVWLNTAVALLSLPLLLALIGEPSRGFRPSGALLREIAALMGAGWVSALVIFLLPRVGLVALGAQGAAEAVGQYSVALALFEIVLILPVAAGGVLTTHLARQSSASSGGGWRPTLMMAGGMALLCGVAVLAAPLLIPLVFGRAFAPAAEPFGWLLLAAWFGTLHQAWQPVLQVRGHARDLLLPPLVAGGLSCLLAWMLVPRLGTAGALASAIAGYAVLAGMTGWLARRG